MKGLTKMNFIDKLSSYLALSIRKNNPNAASEKALFYSLSLIINTMTAIIIVIIISLLTGYLFEALIVIFSYTLLRYFSGGTHMNTSLSCCIMTIIIFSFATHINFPYLPYGVMIDLATISILFKTAPNNIDRVSRIKPEYYFVLKWISVLIVACNFFFQFPVVSASFIIQAILTTKMGHGFTHYFERRKPA
jgi:accessory gene regulator B